MLFTNNPADNNFYSFSVDEVSKNTKKGIYESFKNENNNKDVSIMCFSWNSSNQRLCESLDENVIRENRENTRSSYFSYLTTKIKYGQDCIVADFLNNLTDKIYDSDPTILVFSLQDDPSPGSYFHSDLLIDYFSQDENPNYTLYSRSKIMENSFTTTKGLRTSVYIKTDVKNYFFRPKDLPYENYSSIDGKNCLSINLILPNFDILAILNTKMNFPNDTSLYDSKFFEDYIIRQMALSNKNQIFNKFMRELIFYYGKDSVDKPTYYIFMGDFDYQMKRYVNNKGDETTEDILLQISNQKFDFLEEDELRQQIMKGNVYDVLEGIDNEGPTFNPTCEMDRTRQRTYTKFVPPYEKVISYCNRILYSGNIQCIEYDRFDEGNMNVSTQAGVVGIYQII